MKRDNIRYLIWFVATVVVLAPAIALLNWLVDPLEYYRRAAYPPELSTQARYQNPGLARNYDYDAVIIGTSVSFGFDLHDLAAKTGWQPINLAMQGASAHEQRMILEVALRTGRVKHVLWDMNYEYFRGSPDWVSDFEGPFPFYLYDTGVLDKIPNYLLNVDVTKTSLRVLLRLLLRKPAPMSLDDLSIGAASRAAGRADLLKKWDEIHGKAWPLASDEAAFSIDNTRTSFERNVIEVIKAHPEVTWDLWFPPHAMGYQTVMREQMPAAWEAMFAWKRAVQAETAGLPGVRLFDFQGMTELVLGPAHRLDFVHFDVEAHGMLVGEMVAGNYIATPARLAATEAFLRSEANAQGVEAQLRGH